MPKWKETYIPYLLVWMECLRMWDRMFTCTFFLIKSTVDIFLLSGLFGTGPKSNNMWNLNFQLYFPYKTVIYHQKTCSTAISTTKIPIFPHKMCFKPHNWNDRKLLTTYRYMTVSYYSTVEVRTGVNNVCRSGVNPASVYPVCDHSFYRLWAAYYQCNPIF